MTSVEPKPCHFRNDGIKMKTSYHSVGEGLAPPGREKTIKEQCTAKS